MKPRLRPASHPCTHKAPAILRRSAMTLGRESGSASFRDNFASNPCFTFLQRLAHNGVAYSRLYLTAPEPRP